MFDHATAAVRALGWLAVAVAASGCALHYTDRQGVRHVIGLVDLRLQPQPGGAPGTSGSVDIRTVGLTVYSTGLISGLTLGYNHESLTAVALEAPVSTARGPLPRPVDAAR